MKTDVSCVSETKGMTGGIAALILLMLLVSAFVVQANTSESPLGSSGVDMMDGPMPEPTGGPGSEWIADVLTENLIAVDSFNPSIATGPGDFLHATFQGGADIYYVYSFDAGMSWMPEVGVAISIDEERNPVIAVSPDTGRIFIAYERVTSPGLDSDIYCAWSDDGINWNNVFVYGTINQLWEEPSIVIEHNMGPAFYVYLTFTHVVDPDNMNVAIHRSIDMGLTWSQMINYGEFGDVSVYKDPEITYQRGTDGVDRLFVVFAMGNDAIDMYNIYMLWSTDYAASWNGPYIVYDGTAALIIAEEPTVASSRDGDSIIVAWQRNDAGDYIIQYRSNADPTVPDAGWSAVQTRTPTAGNAANDLSPRLKADGEGTTSIGIGGNYHLIWTTGMPEWEVYYCSRPTDLSVGFNIADPVTDRLQTASGVVPVKGLTTQFRGVGWYPGVVWSDFRAPPYSIMYTTPGSRVTVDTNPTGLAIEVDAAPYLAPVSFMWPAGYLHSLFTLSPQIIGPGSQYVWTSWSDGGAQLHMITATIFDTTYIANFVLQHEYIIDTSPANLDVEVDFFIYVAPATFWWDDGSIHDINAPSPQPAPLPNTRYVWFAWSDAGAQSHQVTATAPSTITAFFDTQYLITIDAYDTTNSVPLPNVPVSINASPIGLTPIGWWLYDGLVVDVGVLDPFNDGFNDYSFVDWSTGSTSNPLSYAPSAPETLVANYVQLPSPYYTLDITPTTRTIAPGQSTTYTVTLTSVNSYTGDVTLTASALPAGLLPPATASFAPNPVTVPSGGQATSTLTISNTAGVTDNTYTITVDGDDGAGTTASDTTELIVATPVFDISAAPPLRTIAPGQQTTYTVTLASVNGYTGNVDLSATALPGGLIPPATATFVPTTVTVPAGGSGTSSLTIDNTAGVPFNLYTITITGDDGSLPPRTTTVDLQVSPLPFFSFDVTPGLRQISPGDITTYTVAAASVNGYVGSVDVSVDTSAIPAGDAAYSWSKTTLAIPVGGSDSAVLTVITTAGIADGDYLLIFYGDDGATNSSDQSTLNVTSNRYYTFDITPTTRTIAPGQQAFYTVTLASMNSYTGDVTLTASALPAGLLPPATASFAPNPVTVPSGGAITSTLTISNTAGVTDNTYTITVDGDDGAGKLWSNTTELVVLAPYFTMDATPDLRSISPTEKTTYIVNVTSHNGYVGTVAVSVSHLLTAGDASLQWSSTSLNVPADGFALSTLYVNTTANIAPRDYTLAFYSQQGVINRTDQSTLNITSGGISGDVRDQDNDVIPNALVELLRGTTVVKTTDTDNNGDYSFGNLGPDTYTVRASKSGYTPDEETVTLAPGELKTSVDLVLEEIRGEIKGKLVDEDTKEPIEGAIVEVYDQDNELVDEGTTTATGRFSIDDLPLGTYTIVIMADGYKTITLEDQEVTETDPVLDLGTTNVTPVEKPVDFLGSYWWLILLIIIIVIVIIILALLLKRKKPAEEPVPPPPPMVEEAPPPGAPQEEYPGQPPEAPPETPQQEPPLE